MYHYLDDAAYENNMRRMGGEIMQALCHRLKEDCDIGATFFLVGSGKRKLILQNANEPVDLDYNLVIVRCEDLEDGRNVKKCVQNAFDQVLWQYGICSCKDSTSVLTSRPFRPWFGKPAFSIDVCIMKGGRGGTYERLIHKKTGWTDLDQYCWNMGPQAKRLEEKAEHIKHCGRWQELRDQYLDIKNRYLAHNDHNHPSFVCYAEAVNNVYNACRNL